MQSWEHVWTLVLAGVRNQCDVTNTLEIVKQVSACVNLPDSIRSELNPTPDNSYLIATENWVRLTSEQEME